MLESHIRIESVIARFTLARAARLAGLSLEATNEAARILKLKVSALDDDAPPGPLISFGGVRLLRDLAPALRRGVSANVAHQEARAAACARLAAAHGGGAAPIHPERAKTLPG